MFAETNREYLGNFAFLDKSEPATRSTFTNYDGGKYYIIVGETRAQITQFHTKRPGLYRLEYPMHSWQELDTTAKRFIAGLLDGNKIVKADTQANKRYIRGAGWSRFYTLENK